MKAQEVYYHVNNGLKHLSEEDAGKITFVAKVAAINRAKNKFEDWISTKTNRNSTVDGWLRPLKRTPESKESDIWKLLDNHSDYNLYHCDDCVKKIESVMAIAQKGKCENRLHVEVGHTRSIPSGLITKFNKPDFQLNWTYRDVVAEGLRVFHGGDFGIKEIEVHWIEKHPDLHFASEASGNNNNYEYFGEIIGHNQDWLYEDGSANVLIDMALTCLLSSTEDMNVVLNRALAKEKIVNNG